MATVRYIVDDVTAAVGFYSERLGFRVVMHPAPQFAMLVRDDLRLNLVSPVTAEQPGGGSRPMADGTMQHPGGWNRFALEVEDWRRPWPRCAGRECPSGAGSSTESAGVRPSPRTRGQPGRALRAHPSGSP